MDFSVYKVNNIFQALPRSTKTCLIKVYSLDTKKVKLQSMTIPSNCLFSYVNYKKLFGNNDLKMKRHNNLNKDQAAHRKKEGNHHHNADKKNKTFN